MISITFRSFLVILVLAVVFTLFSVLIAYRKRRAGSRKVDILKRDGNKIIVNFDECELKSHEYYEEQQTDDSPTNAQMADALFGVYREPGKIATTVSVLIYRYKKGSPQATEYRSELIYMAVESLRLFLEKKKSTCLYVDPRDPSSYFFDMDFLKNPVVV